MIRHKPGRPFTHAGDCTDPDDRKLNTVVGRLGDPLLRCPACRKFKVLRPDLDPAERAPEPIPSRYVCREHVAQPVTWRGTGCRECRAAHADRQRARDGAARERRAER